MHFIHNCYADCSIDFVYSIDSFNDGESSTVNVFDCFCGCSNFETDWHGFEYWKLIRLPQRQPPAFRQKRGGCQSNASLHDAVSQLHRKWNICGGHVDFHSMKPNFKYSIPLNQVAPKLHTCHKAALLSWGVQITVLHTRNHMITVCC